MKCVFHRWTQLQSITISTKQLWLTVSSGHLLDCSWRLGSMQGSLHMISSTVSHIVEPDDQSETPTACAQYLILSTGWWADRQYRARNVVKNICTGSVSFDLLFTPIRIPASHQVRQWGPAACCRYRSAHHQPYRPCCKIHKNELISFSANLIRSLQSNLNFMNFTLVLFIFAWIGTYLWAAAAPASAPTKKSDFFERSA